MGVHCPCLGLHIPLSVLSHCTMGRVGLSMEVHCPCLVTPYPTVRPIPLYHGMGGTVHGSPLSLLRGSISHCPSYPTVPWDGWHCPWESTVPSEGPISHCPSYPIVPWDRWDCPWESTVPSEGPHILLSYLSHFMFYSCPTQVQSIQCIMVAHLFQNHR